jgi:hypothetical protein
MEVNELSKLKETFLNKLNLITKVENHDENKCQRLNEYYEYLSNSQQETNSNSNEIKKFNFLYCPRFIFVHFILVESIKIG